MNAKREDVVVATVGILLAITIVGGCLGLFYGHSQFDAEFHKLVFGYYFCDDNPQGHYWYSAPDGVYHVLASFSRDGTCNFPACPSSGSELHCGPFKIGNGVTPFDGWCVVTLKNNTIIQMTPLEE